MKKFATLFAKVHRVLKVAKEKGLMKKFQKPLTIIGDDVSPKGLPTTAKMQDRYKQVPRGKHQSVIPRTYVREFAFKRFRQRDKQVWRPKP